MTERFAIVALFGSHQKRRRLSSVRCRHEQHLLERQRDAYRRQKLLRYAEQFEFEAPEWKHDECFVIHELLGFWFFRDLKPKRLQSFYVLFNENRILDQQLNLGIWLMSGFILIDCAKETSFNLQA